MHNRDRAALPAVLLIGRTRTSLPVWKCLSWHEKGLVEMAIAGAVVVPVRGDLENDLRQRLDSLEDVSVCGPGKNGIAMVIEAADVKSLRDVSEEINAWEEVVDFQLAYLNWEEESGTDQADCYLFTPVQDTMPL